MYIRKSRTHNNPLAANHKQDKQGVHVTRHQHVPPICTSVNLTAEASLLEDLPKVCHRHVDQLPHLPLRALCAKSSLLELAWQNKHWLRRSICSLLFVKKKYPAHRFPAENVLTLCANTSHPVDPINIYQQRKARA